MTSIRQGSIHLFRLAGIDLFLHWSWFLVAAFEINARAKSYSSLTLERAGVSGAVSHRDAACVRPCAGLPAGGWNGESDRALAPGRPLGGVVYVNPPPRPGPTLWSIAAGPLVNVGLLVFVSLLGRLNRSLGWTESMPNVHAFLRARSGSSTWVC